MRFCPIWDSVASLCMLFSSKENVSWLLLCEWKSKKNKTMVVTGIFLNYTLLYLHIIVHIFWKAKKCITAKWQPFPNNKLLPNLLEVKYIFVRYFYYIGDLKECNHVKTFSPHLRNNWYNTGLFYFFINSLWPLKKKHLTDSNESLVHVCVHSFFI